MVSTVEVEPQMRTDINNMLTYSTVAVNQLAHMQVRLLAGNAEILVGIATDGASVMVGVKTDLTARFKEQCPWLLANHCMAHRLQLSADKATSAGP